MENIPVSFESEGRNYRGTLTSVHGAGTQVYYLMIDKSAKGLDFEKFFVKNNRLCYGQDMGSALPYVDVQNLAKSEYVLFSITKSDTRSDFKTLPVYQSYNKILEELKAAPEVSTDHKEKIKGKLRVLNIEMRQSPDLTETEAKTLMEKFVMP